MTYPPSPQGGYPGPEQQHPGQPEAEQWAPATRAGKQARTPLIVILVVVLVVIIGGGAFAWLHWPKGSVGSQAAPGASASPTSSNQGSGKTSLRGRDKEDLLRVLPTLQGMPDGWKEETAGVVLAGTLEPESCGHVISKGIETSVANRYFVNPADGGASGIEVYLLEWNTEPQLNLVKDYIARCSTFKQIVHGQNGAPDTVVTIQLKEVDPPKAPAESSIGYQEDGTTSPVPDGQDPATYADRYYLGSLRGMNLIFNCRHVAAIEARCNDVFTRTITQFANIN